MRIIVSRRSAGEIDRRRERGLVGAAHHEMSPQRGAHSVLVAEGGSISGIVTRSDMLAYLMNR